MAAEHADLKQNLTPDLAKEVVRKFEPQDLLHLTGENRIFLLMAQETLIGDETRTIERGVPLLAYKMTRELLDGCLQITAERNRLRRFLTEAVIPIISTLKDRDPMSVLKKINHFWKGYEDKSKHIPGFVEGLLLSGRHGAFTCAGKPIEPIPVTAEGSVVPIHINGQEIVDYRDVVYMRRAESTARSAYVWCSKLVEQKKLTKENGYLFLANPNGTGGELIRMINDNGQFIAGEQFMEKARTQYWEWHQQPVLEDEEILLKETYQQLVADMSSDKTRNLIRTKRNPTPTAASVMADELAAKGLAGEPLRPISNAMVEYEKSMQQVGAAVYFELDPKVAHAVVKNEALWHSNYIGSLRVCDERLEITPGHPHANGLELRQMLRDVQVGSARAYKEGFAPSSFQTIESSKAEINKKILRQIAEYKYGLYAKDQITFRGREVIEGTRMLGRIEVVGTEFHQDNYLPAELIGTREAPSALARQLIQEGRNYFATTLSEVKGNGRERDQVYIEELVKRRLWDLLKERGNFPTDEVERATIVETAYQAYLAEIFFPTASTVTLLQNEYVLANTQLMQMGIAARKDIPEELSPYLVWNNRGENGVYKIDEKTGKIIRFDFREAAKMQYRNWLELRNVEIGNMTHQGTLASMVGIENFFAQFSAKALGGQAKKADEMTRGELNLFYSQLRDRAEEQQANAVANQTIAEMTGLRIDTGVVYFDTVKRSPVNNGLFIDKAGKREIAVNLNLSYIPAQEWVLDLLLGRIEKKLIDRETTSRDLQLIAALLTDQEVSEQALTELGQTMATTLMTSIIGGSFSDQVGAIAVETGEEKEEIASDLQAAQATAARLARVPVSIPRHLMRQVMEDALTVPSLLARFIREDRPTLIKQLRRNRQFMNMILSDKRTINIIRREIQKQFSSGYAQANTMIQEELKRLAAMGQTKASAVA